MKSRLAGRSLRSWPGARRLIAFLFAALFTACSAASIQPAARPTPVTLVEGSALESTEPYRDAGFLVGDGPLPFVGIVRYLGTESVDTTMVLVALSIPSRALSFVRAGDRYAAYYAVKIDIMSGQTLVRSERPTGEVRVASFLETTRGDDGVVFQRALRIAPGSYSIRVTAQDSLGASTGVAAGSIAVPYMANGVLAPIIPVFAADLRSARAAAPMIVVNPRSTVRFGKDSTLGLYVEAYGAEAPDTVVFTTRPVRDSGVVLRRDTLIVPRGRELRAAMLTLRADRLGLGAVRVTAARANGVSLGSAIVIISIGADLPIATVDELFDALKFFVTDAELLAMRSAPAERRATLWAALVRQTDPNPGTTDNEALVEYFRRLRLAHALYREDAAPGWLTDRGSVIAALGEPDAMSEPQPADSVGLTRLLTWEFRRHRVWLTFIDASGFGRWRLSTASEADFRAILALAGPCVGCR